MFRNPQTLTNGLEKVYKGEFEQDPSADFIVEVVDKYNYNTEILDDSLGEVALFKAQIASLALYGDFEGYSYGGVCGRVPPIQQEETAQSISRMYVTPLDYSGDLPVIADPPTVSDPNGTDCTPDLITLYDQLPD